MYVFVFDFKEYLGLQFPHHVLWVHMYVSNYLHRVLGELGGNAAGFSLKLESWHTFTSEIRHSRTG